VNQDILGKQAKRVIMEKGYEVWVKELEDGSKAVGLFNTGVAKDPADYFVWDDQPVSSKSVTVSATFEAMGISGKQVVRDLWRQKDLGEFSDKLEMEVPFHGVVFVKVTPSK
ncbi:MAG: alpha-galactosidase, partial [Bacteroidales bacterium]|nr:alpha-galactosidase [Bacteroidales bacterium]